LENSAVKSDQIFVDQPVSGADVLVKIHLQQGANGVVTVKREPISIRGEHQKQVEKDFLLLQRGQESIAKKPVRDEAEPTIDAPDTIRVENFLFYHQVPFSDQD
jgi:hypothetical protein